MWGVRLEDGACIASCISRRLAVVQHGVGFMTSAAFAVACPGYVQDVLDGRTPTATPKPSAFGPP